MKNKGEKNKEMTGITHVTQKNIKDFHAFDSLTA